MRFDLELGAMYVSGFNFLKAWSHERWPHWDSSCPRTPPPTERCYQLVVADPDSYTEVKINSPDSSVCLSEDDGLHTFLLCTQVLCLRPPPPPSLSFISIFLHRFHPSSTSPSSPFHSVPFLSWFHLAPFFIFYFLQRPCLFNDERTRREPLSVYPSPPISISSSPCPLSSPRGRAVMCNQRDRDRTFHRDKVNRTMRGLTKLLTPRQLNMNKRCARCVCVCFFFQGAAQPPNISRNELAPSLCSASFSCQPVEICHSLLWTPPPATAASV